MNVQISFPSTVDPSSDAQFPRLSLNLSSKLLKNPQGEVEGLELKLVSDSLVSRVFP